MHLSLKSAIFFTCTERISIQFSLFESTMTIKILMYILQHEQSHSAAVCLYGVIISSKHRMPFLFYLFFTSSKQTFFYIIKLYHWNIVFFFLNETFYKCYKVTKGNITVTNDFIFIY